MCVCPPIKEERASLLKELQALREKRSHLKSKLEKDRECDPEVIEEMSEYPVTSLSKKGGCVPIIRPFFS